MKKALLHQRSAIFATAVAAAGDFGALLFEPKIFRKQMYCIDKSICDIVELYGATLASPHYAPA